MSDPQQLMRAARAVIDTERQAVSALKQRIDDHFVGACQLVLACEGRVVVLGMGKSGHIGHKIAATLASTGTPSFFVHPAEAGHGDLGMITRGDVVIALSNSGETAEIITLLPVIKRLDIPLIALTGNPASTLGTAAAACLDVSVAREACPLNLAPTASTTACLVLGDALAIALLEARGFNADDFARSHPGGSLGRRLSSVRDVMHTGDDIPRVNENTILSRTLLEMSAKGLGMTAVLDEQGEVSGIFTDGDLRRTLDAGFDVHTTTTAEVMTRNPRTIAETCLAAEALRMMEQHRVNALLVLDENQQLAGVLNMHDLLRAQVL
ncbi:MAG: KpsF/GutQ family sugar-phosphate isomerase [Gammaproteobacteria bacterium]|nr:KpsF/GutQ family sugar-phosphate isomerase [Gammaproteobacteria bacterium]MDE0513426.1 KpsF/GutQ family sugar-phosphate isomerase [Gammaproteobacteria bacterium]